MNLHEELRIKIIDELSEKLWKAEKEVTLLKSQVNKLVVNYKNSEKSAQNKNIKNPKEAEKKMQKKICDSSITNNYIDRNKSNSSPTNKKNNHINNPPPTTSDNSIIVTDTTFSSKNVKFNAVENIDIQLKNLLSFDFNEEKYNIISSSPISTPKALKEKQVEILKDETETNIKSKKETNLNIKHMKK
jgi:hypothetical protein